MAEQKNTAWRLNIRRGGGALLAVLLTLSTVVAPITAVAQRKASIDDEKGITIGPMSRARGLASAEEVEQMAARQYTLLKKEADAKGALAPPDYPPLKRIRAIAERIIPHVARFNPRAPQWQWEISMIGSKQINAFCMPGGKIAFFTGIIDTLKLTDDEIALVMGHEIGHALREHGRERVGKAKVANVVTIGASIFSQILGYGNLGGALSSQGSQLLLLKYGRDDEKEADLVGMDLAARSGFDPRAGIVLWQKMAAVSKGQPPQWLSTHPSHGSRIAEIQAHLPEVLPLYAHATDQDVNALPPYKGNWTPPQQR